MALREIPAGSVEVQTGLWAYLNPVTSKYKLYSAEGYCFYDVTDEMNYDPETGDLLPENERTYAQYRSTVCTTIEQINARFVSVPVQDGYDILNKPTDTETV